MKKFLLFALLFASPAFASFASHECSSPEGYYRYSFYWAWDTPQTERWWLNGREITARTEEVGERTALERYSDQMQESTTYAVKLRVTQATYGEPKIWEGYVICRSAGGI